jgi:hypothetical protein
MMIRTTGIFCGDLWLDLFCIGDPDDAYIYVGGHDVEDLNRVDAAAESYGYATKINSLIPFLNRRSTALERLVNSLEAC